MKKAAFLQSNHLNKRKEYLFLFLFTLFACLLRLFLILHDWPSTNADEATMGLMALHIEQGRDFPIFFYGQGYMGTLQAYLGSILFHLFCTSLYALRVGLILIFAVFFVTIYFLVKIVYSRSFAFLCLLLYTLGSANIIGTQLFANGGYAETLLFSALIFLLVAQMILQRDIPDQQPNHLRWRRLLHWGVVGFFIGIAIYSDILILPTLLCSTLLLYIFMHGELFSRAGLLLIGGLLLALLPTIIYNLSVPFSQGTLAAYVGSSGYAATTTTKGGITFAQQFLQALLITLPDATGLSPVCNIHEPMHAGHAFFEIFGPQQQICALSSIGWATGYIALVLLASLQLVRVLLSSYRHRSRTKFAGVPPHENTLYWIRLMLIVSAVITFTLYVVSAPAALNPRTTARYLSGMLIAIPALVWPLWQSILHINKISWQKRIIAVGLLLSAFLLFFKGTADIFTQFDTSQAMISQQQTLIDFLSQHKITRFYTDYWTCNNLIFQSHEQLLCANLDEQLQTGLDRYLPYRDAVKDQLQGIYIFKVHSQQTIALDEKVTHHPEIHVKRTVIANYVIYQAPTQFHMLT
ncbi:hypothetical protein ccbrp13_16310 [Ktedonobacteria bacterium brp13]|nr:hypothetical protein ccbrp13_16310 [Ktedonobacteria bacterium brp13]